MNQNITENAFSVSADFPEFYTAVHYYCGIPVLRSIVLENIPENVCGELTVKIQGSFGNLKVIDLTHTVPDFCACGFVCDTPASIPLSLEKINVLPEAKFIKNLSAKASVKITASVSLGTYSAVCSSNVKFLPEYHIPAKMSPELLCAYVQPGCNFASKIAGGAVALSRKINEQTGGKYPRALALTMAIFSLLQNENITYSATLSEFYDSDCTLRSPDSIMASNSRIVSLTEAALIYCSCAERCGLSTNIIYLRKGAGSMRVLIATQLKERIKPEKPVSESITELRERILSNEIFVFDLVGFLSTENTDFAKNVSETVQLIFKTSSTLSFCIDVALSRQCGVASLLASRQAPANKIQSYESVSESVEKIEQLELRNILRTFSPYTCASIGLICKGALKIGKTYNLCALDDEVFTQDPDTIGLFSTFSGKYPERKARNNAEQSLYVSKLQALMQKIVDSEKRNSLHAYPTRYFLKCDKPSFDKTRDEFLRECHAIIDKTEFSRIEGASLNVYAATGILEIAETNETLYVPCVFVPCRLDISGNTVEFTYGVDAPIINTCLINYISGKYSVKEDFITFGADNDIKAFLTRTRSICEKCESLKFHSDTLISCFDLSFSLMRECLEKGNGKKFERCLESGKYEFSDGDRENGKDFDASLPFECASNIRSAVKCAENDSIIISGPAGSGRKSAVANIISRTALKGETLIVSSKYRDSLDSLQSLLETAGLGELCLTFDDAKCIREKIKADLEKLKSEPVKPENTYGKDLKELSEELDVYAEEMYADYDFGYSLYDCIEEYCKYDAIAEGTSAAMQTDISAMNKSDTQKLFKITDGLCENALEVMAALSGKTICDYGLEHIRITGAPHKDTSKLINAALSELSVFTEKSEFARSTLGILSSDIVDMKSFMALGELFELIIKSGIDYIPETVFTDNIYRNAKCTEEFVAICDELTKTDSKISEITSKLPDGSDVELYNRWCTAESKTDFAKELKKEYSDKGSLSRKDFPALVKLLDLKERLENEFSNIAPDVEKILGSIYDGKNTDTEKSGKIAALALSADANIKKIFKDYEKSMEAFSSGISKLVSTIFSGNDEATDFILSVGSFRKLCADGENHPYLVAISKALSVDMLDIKFDCGLLEENGLAKLLTTWKENIDIIGLLPKYNLSKKEAISAGLGGFVDYIESSTRDDIGALLRKSIFAGFARYIMSQRPCLASENMPETYKKYCDIYAYSKQLAAYNLISTHRSRFKAYISSAEGRSALFALSEALSCETLTPGELIKKHSLIIGEMYPALFMTNECAYRHAADRNTLVLLDCEKTSPSEGIPLIASFDKCIFITSPFENSGSIISSLPLGIPQLELTRIVPEKIGTVSSFVADTFLGSQYTFTCENNTQHVSFVKCEGGLYDKNSLTSKIEAVKVCETAYEYAKQYGYENVGIIAFTPNQVFEINSALRILAGKYSDARIGTIPARYTGNLGDLSKKCIVLSTTFGKNIYSITRSFGDLDDMALTYLGNPIAFEKLLLAEDLLCIVSSLEPEDIPVCTASCGAPALRKLLEFAKYRCAHIANAKSSNIPGKIIRECECEELPRIYNFDGAVAIGDDAVLYENGYIRDTYDRIVLPMREFSLHGYSVKFSNILDLLK